MLETSQDLFYVVLAFCILWFTVFMCWALYYFIKMLKQTNELLEDIKHRITQASNVFTFLKSKMFTETVKGVVSFVKSAKEKKSQKTKKSK
jgi:hypothetical protein